jgi:protease I
MIASPKAGEIKGWWHTDWGGNLKVDPTLDEVDAASFDTPVLPGGQINPDKLRLEPNAVGLVQAFVQACKLVAAICHGPWLLTEADFLDWRAVTSWPSIRTDLRNAGL